MLHDDEVTCSINPRTSPVKWVGPKERVTVSSRGLTLDDEWDFYLAALENEWPKTSDDTERIYQWPDVWPSVDSVVAAMAQIAADPQIHQLYPRLCHFHLRLTRQLRYDVSQPFISVDFLRSIVILFDKNCDRAEICKVGELSGICDAVKGLVPELQLLAQQ